MLKSFNIYTNCAFGAYIIKLLVDLVMFLLANFGITEFQDFWFMFVPQAISTGLLIVFYVMFIKYQDQSIILKILTYVMIAMNIIALGIIFYDGQYYKGITDEARGLNEYGENNTFLIMYLCIVAMVNFLNGFYLKCNVIPRRKEGETGYAPLIFELVAFVVMALSLYSIYCSFPAEYNLLKNEWELVNREVSLRLNLISETILVYEYIMCRKNNSEYIRDNLFDEMPNIDDFQ